MKRKNDGFAVVYGLAVLFVASISGISIMYISQKDHNSASDYSKMRSAAVAARSALDAFEGQCISQPQNVLDILKQYNRNPSKKWLLSDVGHAGSEQKIKFLNSNDASTFSACIMKFDSTNLLMQVQGIGYGGSGGKKNAIGIYKLEGIKASSTWIPKDAIYLAGEGRSFDILTKVKGNVYFGADVRFQGGAVGSVIDGDFKTGPSDKKSEFDIPLVIKGNAYFQTPLKVLGTYGLTIHGKSGFEKEINTNPSFNLFKDAFVNGNMIGTGRLEMNYNPVIYSGLHNIANKFYQASPAAVNNNGLIDIASRLGMQSGNDPSLNSFIINIPDEKIFNISKLAGWSNFTAANVQAKYDDAALKNQLWNGFLVIKIDKDANMGVSFTTFTGKVIWIVDKKINCNANWYKCSPSSNTLVCVRSGGYIEDMGSAFNFRGFIYVEGTGSVKYSWRNGHSINGAIHHTSEKSGFHLNAGGSLDITFDAGVLSEIMGTGVIGYSGGMSGGLILADTKIRPKLVSISY
ncbi:MAG TPA: hypothetical protein VHP36_10180 [Chitinispirillaceae bacterium]|nr:hypothetical protein [Chitinispirillaceae bacterium]